MAPHPTYSDLILEVHEILTDVASLTGSTGFNDGYSNTGYSGHSGGNMKVEKEFAYNPGGSWQIVNPYTMAFVYPKDGEPFIVKGGYISVKKYLEAEKRPAVVHYVLWHRKLSRRIIETINCGKVIIQKLSEGKHGLWEVGIAKIGITPYKVITRMKKLPRKWIKELDEYISNKAEDTKAWRRIVL